jgi:hypothetical protein
MPAAPHLQPLTRRRAILLGVAAGIGTVATFGVDPVGGVPFIDLNQGNLQPMPIAGDILTAQPILKGMATILTPRTGAG